VGQLRDSIVALDKGSVLKTVEQELAAGRDPLSLVDEARQGLEDVGSKFECGEFFLMELMRAAQIFQSAAALINPRIKERYGGIETKGKVVLGTVAGDIHDLGKNIVKILLECRGVGVVDLGVDVAPQRFVDKVREIHPDVVGMSALLTASIPQMRKTIEAMETAAVRKDLKVIVGGGIVGEVRLTEVNADHATTDANEGVKRIEQWVGGGS
jgi:methanogenic corrinoid protein MtbC1